MNKKHALEFLITCQKIILSTIFIFLASGFTFVQAEQTIVSNPMLSSSPVRYGPYTSSNHPMQIQSTTSESASSTTAKSSHHSKKENATGIININSASETELVALPGIGPSKARAIAEYRQKKGGFKSVEELQQVKGIGPATLEKLRAYVTL